MCIGSTSKTHRNSYFELKGHYSEEGNSLAKVLTRTKQQSPRPPDNDMGKENKGQDYAELL